MDPRGPPSGIKLKKGNTSTGLYPLQELEALSIASSTKSSNNSESSEDEGLDPEEEAELEEEAARYEEERYHPDDHPSSNRGLKKTAVLRGPFTGGSFGAPSL